MKYNVRKPIFRVFAGMTAFLIMIFLIIVATAIFYRPKPAQPNTSNWRTGMVFFSVGDSWESIVVRSISSIFNIAVSDSTPSHCGIIIVGDKGPLLVHASTTAGHVVAETPAEYILNNGSYCLYTKPLPFQLDTLKLKSDIDSLLNIPVSFDFDFNHSDNKSLYCTELVITLYELNGCNSFSSLRENHFIYPQDILNILNISK